MRDLRSLLLLLPLLLFACDDPNGDLCRKYFIPYPDIISGRERTPANADYLDAMQAYALGDMETAEAGLRIVVKRHAKDASARLYLAVSLLAQDKPFDAELELDHLEQLEDKAFQDQVDLYNLLCLVCSDQPERARELAEELARKQRHTYKQEIAEMLEDLRSSAQ